MIDESAMRGTRADTLSLREASALVMEERKQQTSRAVKVFDLFIKGALVFYEFSRNENGEVVVSNSLTDEISSAIRDNLDRDSIPYFVEMILDNQQKARQSSNATKRHSENYATKAAVFDWLDSNMANFKSMDKAAEAVTKQQPIAFRTARDYVSQWKKLRAAGTA